MLMRFVRVESGQGAWSATALDPGPYLEVLDDLLPQLPDGARAFASDADHYDFTASRCVKDLTVKAISLREAGQARVGAVIEFEPNRFKHDGPLTIVYDGVQNFTMEVDEMNSTTRIWPESRRLGSVQLDEIVPSAVGCRHEIRMTGGVVIIDCADLRASWAESSIDVTDYDQDHAQ
ncbi:MULTISPECIES: hypothetical protein [Catenuloplanes]|uniref:Uncharacterized protein n=1 Tax=Catenuloplanes niger TaxID=587534 RepID=A0AAE3ZUL7_9ACTN|nr:hypothetical protein [Catenuloplanes niger]MDR7325404.1 hypothetical protein [Catenuloplanes niger]